MDFYIPKDSQHLLKIYYMPIILHMRYQDGIEEGMVTFYDHGENDTQ